MRVRSHRLPSALLWAVAACAAACSSAHAQERAAATQSSSPAAPAVQPERIDALLEPLLAEHGVPALGGAVVELERGLVAVGVAGVRARGQDARVELDDAWHLGSCTKAMTATLAARLVQQGKLTFDTTVAEALPELAERMHESWRGVKLEWLLQNRGGAPGKPPPLLWLELYARDKDPLAARSWFVEKLLEAPAVEAGKKFEYSNQGFVIAGRMLEARTGKSWEELMARELFEPLQMTGAGFGPPGAADVLDQPRGHNPKPQAPGPRADNPRALGPAGTVHASLADWSKFVHAHLRGSATAKGFVPSGLFEALHTPPPTQAYAMGWNRTSRPWGGGDVLTHAGSNTMWFCVVWIAPEKGVALLATCNQGGDAGPKACDAVVVALAKARGLL